MAEERKCRCASLVEAARPCGHCRRTSALVRAGREAAARKQLSAADWAVRRVIAKAKHRAKADGRAFDLTYERVRELVMGVCFWCGSEPHQRTVAVNRQQRLMECHGLDRVNSEDGYTAENVVGCCAMCNRMKLDSHYKVFVKHAKAIARHDEARGRAVAASLGVPLPPDDGTYAIDRAFGAEREAQREVLAELRRELTYEISVANAHA